MGCQHGHAIAECPDRRCQGGENTADTIAEWLAGRSLSTVDEPPAPHRHVSRSARFDWSVCEVRRARWAVVRGAVRHGGPITCARLIGGQMNCAGRGDCGAARSVRPTTTARL
jgi:hypothetical protein